MQCEQISRTTCQEFGPTAPLIQVASDRQWPHPEGQEVRLRLLEQTELTDRTTRPTLNGQTSAAPLFGFGFFTTFLDVASPYTSLHYTTRHQTSRGEA